MSEQKFYPISKDIKFKKKTLFLMEFDSIKKLNEITYEVSFDNSIRNVKIAMPIFSLTDNKDRLKTTIKSVTKGKNKDFEFVVLELETLASPNKIYRFRRFFKYE